MGCRITFTLNGKPKYILCKNNKNRQRALIYLRELRYKDNENVEDIEVMADDCKELVW